MSKMLTKMLSVHYERRNIFSIRSGRASLRFPISGGLMMVIHSRMALVSLQGSRSASAFVSLRLDLLQVFIGIFDEENVDQSAISLAM